MDNKFNRREAIKQISIVAGGATAAIVLPSTWTKPVMDAVVGPAAAGFVSFCQDGTLYSTYVTRPNFSSCPQPTTTTIGPSTPPP